MPVATYKFSQFADLLLFKLYELDREQGGKYFDLNAIAKDILGEIPEGWNFDAAKVLKSRGLAEVMFTFGGTHAKISGEGRLYIEEGRGFTHEVQNSPGSFFVSVHGSNNQVITGHNASEVTQSNSIINEQAPVFQILDEMKQTLVRDSSLTGERRQEALTYIELLRGEIKKSEPNRSLVSVVLESLHKITSIGANLASLIKLFNETL